MSWWSLPCHRCVLNAGSHCSSHWPDSLLYLASTSTEVADPGRGASLGDDTPAIPHETTYRFTAGQRLLAVRSRQRRMHCLTQFSMACHFYHLGFACSIYLSPFFEAECTSERFTGGLGWVVSCYIYSRSFYYRSCLTLHTERSITLCAFNISGNNQQTSAAWPQMSRCSKMSFSAKTNDLWIAAYLKTSASIEASAERSSFCSEWAAAVREEKLSKAHSVSTSFDLFIKSCSGRNLCILIYLYWKFTWLLPTFRPESVVWVPFCPARAQKSIILASFSFNWRKMWHTQWLIWSMPLFRKYCQRDDAHCLVIKKNKPLALPLQEYFSSYTF